MLLLFFLRFISILIVDLPPNTPLKDPLSIPKAPLSAVDLVVCSVWKPVTDLLIERFPGR